LPDSHLQADANP